MQTHQCDRKQVGGRRRKWVSVILITRLPGVRYIGAQIAGTHMLTGQLGLICSYVSAWPLGWRELGRKTRGLESN